MQYYHAIVCKKPIDTDLKVRYVLKDKRSSTVAGECTLLYLGKEVLFFIEVFEKCSYPSKCKESDIGK